MRKLLRLFWCAIALAWSVLAVAQEQNISGTVRDPRDNSPLAAATIVNKRTKKTVLTNETGAYTIVAQPGDVLTISHVGRKTVTLTIGSATSYSTLLQPSGDLGEAVVTAMDIKRNPRELGYSVQVVGGEDIKESQRENFITDIQGRVAGATVTPTNGQAGASAALVLRGFNSLSLSNQPIYVVDGVIVDNTTQTQTSNTGTQIGFASDGSNKNNDYTNRIADISPSDILTITVLKGAEATALYGSQASSGAIIITTRKPGGNGGIRVSYDDAFRLQKITRFEKTINTYNTGVSGIYQPEYGGTAYQYWGPAYGANTQQFDNVHHFFKTGFTNEHNISADFGPKVSAWRFSFGYINADGVVPQNQYQKENFRLVNTTKFGKWGDITPSFMFVNDVNNKPLRGIGGYLTDLYAYPSTIDVRNYAGPHGSKILLNPADSTVPNNEIDNPLWSATQNKSQDKSYRYIATVAVNLHPTTWADIAGRFGYDWYHTNSYTFTNPESGDLTTATGGSLDNLYVKNMYYNHTITATVHHSLGKFNGRLLVGTEWQNTQRQGFAVYGTNLIDSSSTDSNNTKPNTRVRLNRNVFGLPNLEILRVQSYFGEAAVNYDNMIFLNFTERFEEASVFPPNTRNYNYPGATASVILSDLFPGIKKGALDYLKLRGALAHTARLADPYSNQSVFVNSTSSGGGYGYSFTNANPNLKPERHQTWEGGLEGTFFRDRLSIDATYYNTYVKDDIIEGYRTSYATGFIINTSNVANLRNQGVELTLTANPVRTRDWNWTMALNFNKMWSKVLTLPASLTEYYLGDTQIFGAGTLGTAARGGIHKGGPSTTVTGWTYARNNRNQILINPQTGLPTVQTSWSTIGDRNPKFAMGWTNMLAYKNWSLSFLWDLKVGGAVYNGTQAYLTQIGRDARTADRIKPRVVKGVLQDGNENGASPTPNNIVITPYYQYNYYKGMSDEEFIQKNVNWFRLRDLTLNYAFDRNLVAKLKYFKGLGAFLTVNNLLQFTNYSGADPDVNLNTGGNQGVGGFAIDYGNLPAPISLNIGIRAAF